MTMKKSGFTLLEILTVMGVILILAGIILPSFRGFQNEANFTKAHSDLSMLKTGVESYRRYRAGLLPENITTNLTQSSPQIITEVLSDPFETISCPLAKTGFTYAYVTNNIVGFGNLYVIYSLGFGKNGTVTWDRDLTINVVVSVNDNAIAVSNAPVR